MKSLLFAFIPLFVAIDAFGTLPLFLGLTENFSEKEKRRLALQAVTTALGVGVGFGVFGQIVFSFLGITSADFQIGGGLLLMIFSVREIFGITSKTTEKTSADNLIGVVPLGIPLLAGPAMITTILILQHELPFFLIILALVLNLLLALVLFIYSGQILNRIGVAGAKVVAKIVAIFLTAISVMMIRKGLETLLLGR